MLKENGLKSIPLERFRGNRFNVLFRNAGAVFFLKDEIKNFLDLESSNRLLAAVSMISTHLNILLVVKL